MDTFFGQNDGSAFDAAVADNVVLHEDLLIIDSSIHGKGKVRQALSTYTENYDYQHELVSISMTGLQPGVGVAEYSGGGSCGHKLLACVWRGCHATWSMPCSKKAAPMLSSAACAGGSGRGH